MPSTLRRGRAHTSPGWSSGFHLRAATLDKASPGLVHQLAIVAFKRLFKDILKAGGKHPQRCLLSGHQRRLDSARIFPAMEQLEQDKGLV